MKLEQRTRRNRQHQGGCHVGDADLKPDNVMIVSDPEAPGERAKILDFGIANIVLPLFV